MAQLIVADDDAQLADLAAERVTQVIVEAVAGRGRALVSLAGGNTPRRLYANLADAGQPWRDRIPWAQVHLFWGDERHVPPDHADSNYAMVTDALLDRVAIPADHVHRIRGELPDARDAARGYGEELERVASAFRRKNPLFDLMLLGLGEDAHIASIFPGSPLLEGASHERVAAVWASHLNAWRITLTPATILDSQSIVVLATGEKKANAVREALNGRLNLKKYPAQLLRSAGDRVEWFLGRSISPERAASAPRPS
jgi:6-phosphogluconolactonase